MESAALSAEPLIAEPSPAAILRGTARGLEVVVDGNAAVTDIIGAVTDRLEEAPGFFKGSDVRVRVDNGPLPSGCLSCLDDLAVRYDLRIVEVAPLAKPDPRDRKRTLATATPPGGDIDAVPVTNLASGSAPSPAFEDEEPTSSNGKLVALPPAQAEIVDAAEPVMLDDSDLQFADTAFADAEAGTSFDEPTNASAPRHLAATPEIPLRNEPGTRVVIGPVRSGVILEHVGHLIIFGDINPGAEVRASGNIVVLGRLRGTAHAGIGQDVGFILALRLEPQQLRIGRQVARAADSDTPASEPELAYGTGDSIIVERYQGKLPRNLATSI
jgi:septum formation inhibitor MinC